MNIRSKHPAVHLLDSVRKHHLDRPGTCSFGPWLAYWFPLENGKTQVRINAPVRLEKAQAVETVIALAEAGVISMIGEDCEGCKTEINCVIPNGVGIPIRIEEDEEGYPRVIAMQSRPSHFPYGGDVA